MSSLDLSELRARCMTAVDTAIAAAGDSAKLVDKLLDAVERLPMVIRSADMEAQQRAERKDNLSCLAKRFVLRFVRTQGYCYASGSGFKLYNGEHFHDVNEDQVIMDIFGSLSRENELRKWKHKVKSSTMKAVRAVSPLDVLPDSATVQNVLVALGPFFPRREHTKYFLAVIGDMLNGRNEHLVYVAAPALRELIQELACQCSLHLRNASQFGAIKFRYRDYPYDSVRFLSACANPPSGRVNMRHSLDVLVVAGHYSSRYGGSDGFLAQSDDDELQHSAKFVVGRTLDAITDAFIKSRLEKGSGRIGTRQMTFVWKKHLSDIGVHSVGYHDIVHDHIKKHLDFCTENDAYLGVTSRDLPLVAAFCEFWDNSIIEVANDELEISEIIRLFLASSGRSQLAGVQNGAAKETIFLDMIDHFYSHIEIADDKHTVKGVACTIWAKKNSVVTFIQNKLSSQHFCESDDPEISELYNEYCLSCEKYVASKEYFENMLIELI